MWARVAAAAVGGGRGGGGGWDGAQGATIHLKSRWVPSRGRRKGHRTSPQPAGGVPFTSETPRREADSLENILESESAFIVVRGISLWLLGVPWKIRRAGELMC